MINEILSFNQIFVQQKSYASYKTSKYPSKKLAILSCMDTRLTELLPAALGLKNGDAKIIKNAGGVIAHPFGSVVRSLLVAIYELGVTEIMIIGHTDCGVQHLDSNKLMEEMIERGISAHDLHIMKSSGINFEKWLGGFEDSSESIRSSVKCLVEHPLIPDDIIIKGFIMNSETGELSTVI